MCDMLTDIRYVTTFSLMKKYNGLLSPIDGE